MDAVALARSLAMPVRPRPRPLRAPPRPDKSCRAPLVAAAVLPRRGAGNPASEVRRGALTLRGECLFRAPAEPKWSVIFRLRFLRYGIIEAVKTTLYFEGKVLENPERRGITVELCERIVSEAEHAEEQRDGRFRFWGYVPERQMYLRVIASGDREVLINAFFDSNFTRKQRRSR